jgi:hypothetical protein
MALPKTTTSTGATSTTVVYQPLGGQRRRIVLVGAVAFVIVLALAATQSLVPTTSDTRRARATQPISIASPTTPQLRSEPIQPLDAPLVEGEYGCGLACTEEMATLWRSRAQPNADLDAIDQAFGASVRTALNTIEKAVVDAARALP